MRRFIKLFFIIQVLFLSQAPQVFSQLDILVNYQNTQYNDWEDVLVVKNGLGVELFDQVAGAGLAYRIYPFQYRVGILPQLTYSSSFGHDEEASNGSNYKLNQSSFSIGLQIFPFDLQGDCNCPTFGKQNDYFQKTFYLKFIPGINYLRYKVSDTDKSKSANNLSASLGVGSGINIALSEKLTLIPEISYHILLGSKWEGFSEWHKVEDRDQSRGTALMAGLRFSFYLWE